MRLSELGELGLLAELERRHLIVGVEHDAAELAGGLILTQDALVEGVHFRLDWIAWRDLGWRQTVRSNLSDLAASGADPRGFWSRWRFRPEATTRVDDVLALYEGLAETGVPVIGGDTTAAGTVVISITAIGHSSRVPGRAGAQPGDLLVVTGELGGAGAAFRNEFYIRPPLRLAEGKRLAAHAHALLDISDGLPVDAGHIARRSGVRCVIDLERVPRAAGATISELGFGEDFELLAAVADADRFTVIGHVEQGEGVELRLSGRPYALRGFEHFATR